MTRCCICSQPTRGWDWHDQAWCPACYADHIARGDPWRDQGARPAPTRGLLTDVQRRHLARWQAALGVDTLDEPAPP
jgi:hypothetical protein